MELGKFSQEKYIDAPGELSQASQEEISLQQPRVPLIFAYLSVLTSHTIHAVPGTYGVPEVTF